MKKLILFLCFSFILASSSQPQTTWQANLDPKVGFYQSTDFGLILAATEKSIYAIDSQTGSIQWRRKTGKVNETAVTPRPSTDPPVSTRALRRHTNLGA